MKSSGKIAGCCQQKGFDGNQKSNCLLVSGKSGKSRNA